MELQVQKLWSTVLSTHRTGWSTSTAKSAELKAVQRGRRRVAGTKTVEYCVLRKASVAHVDRRLLRYYLIVRLLPNVFALACRS